MAGLPVIVAGKTHYAGKGFTIDPPTWQAYTQTLDEILHNPAAFRLSPAQVEQAWLYAYLFFFEFSLPFPWHLLWLGEDFRLRPMHYVLSPERPGTLPPDFWLPGWRAVGLVRTRAGTPKRAA